MSNDPKLQNMIDQMRNKGSLPAISQNVRDITNITHNSDTCATDLATVILRDCGLTSNILATANSIIYSPRYPLKTVSYAVAYLGFEKTHSIALGLSIFKQTMQTVKAQQLANLYVSSYFSGLFAMSLAKKTKYKNPEEIFIAGLLYRLPWLALANTFPEEFKEMEIMIIEDNIPNNEACRKVFGVRYDDIFKALINIYNLPDKIVEVLCNDVGLKNPLVSLVRDSCHISNMIFGTNLGGKESMKKMEIRIKKDLEIDEFEISDFIRDACEKDVNISRFFHLGKDDVDMMVKALEWGKGNPAQIAGKIGLVDPLNEVEELDDPDVLIGQFLTDMMIACRKDPEINKILMLAQEILFRCLIGTEVFTAFFDKEKTRMTGKFYAGNDSTVKAWDFKVKMEQMDSPIVESIKNMNTVLWNDTETTLRLSQLGKILRFKFAVFSPIIVFDKVVGMYFVGKTSDTPLQEKEVAWFEQIVMLVGQAFENSQK